MANAYEFMDDVAEGALDLGASAVRGSLKGVTDLAGMGAAGLEWLGRKAVGADTSGKMAGTKAAEAAAKQFDKIDVKSKLDDSKAGKIVNQGVEFLGGLASPGGLAKGAVKGVAKLSGMKLADQAKKGMDMARVILHDGIRNGVDPKAVAESLRNVGVSDEGIEKAISIVRKAHSKNVDSLYNAMAGKEYSLDKAVNLEKAGKDVPESIVKDMDSWSDEIGKARRKIGEGAAKELNDLELNYDNAYGGKDYYGGVLDEMYEKGMDPSSASDEAFKSFKYWSEEERKALEELRSSQSGKKFFDGLSKELRGLPKDEAISKLKKLHDAASDPKIQNAISAVAAMLSTAGRSDGEEEGISL